jgi:hypothetical protein
MIGQVQWLTPIVLATWDIAIGRIEVQAQCEQIVFETPISKIARTKWTGSVAQVVEYLLCKHEALSLNPSREKKKKEGRKEGRKGKKKKRGHHYRSYRQRTLK